MKKTPVLALALCLFVLCVQGNSQTHKAENRKKSYKVTANHPLLFVNQDNSEHFESESNKDSRAEVRVVPAQTKDRWDKAVVWINGALAVIGAIGIAVAVITLRKIERQTVATIKSANAANVSARAAMGVALPTLKVVEFSIRPRGHADAKAGLQAPKIEITFKNFGASPAFLSHYSLNVTCEPLTAFPRYEVPIHFSDASTVESQKTHCIDDALTLMPYFVGPDLESLFRKDKFITVFGYVAYSDVFGSPIRYLKFSKKLVQYQTLHAPLIGNWDPVLFDEGGEKYTGQKQQRGQHPN